MATTLCVSIPRNAPPLLTFPARCVGCEGAPDTESTLAVSRLVVNHKTGAQRPVKVRYQIPHCAACARRTKSVFLASLLPFTLGFLVIGLAAFAVVGLGAMALGLDEMGRPVNSNSLVLGAAAGLAAGLAGGFACEVAARLLLVPIFGRGLLRAPLLVPSLFTDADHVAGLTGRPNADFTRLTLTFDNEAIAREFSAANARQLCDS